MEEKLAVPTSANPFGKKGLNRLPSVEAPQVRTPLQPPPCDSPWECLYQQQLRDIRRRTRLQHRQPTTPFRVGAVLVRGRVEDPAPTDGRHRRTERRMR